MIHVAIFFTKWVNPSRFSQSLKSSHQKVKRTDGEMFFYLNYSRVVLIEVFNLEWTSQIVQNMRGGEEGERRGRQGSKKGIQKESLFWHYDWCTTYKANKDPHTRVFAFFIMWRRGYKIRHGLVWPTPAHDGSYIYISVFFLKKLFSIRGGAILKIIKQALYSW